MKPTLPVPWSSWRLDPPAPAPSSSTIGALQQRILTALDNGPLNLSDLQAALGGDDRSLSTSLLRLRRRGLIQRTPHDCWALTGWTP